MTDIEEAADPDDAGDPDDVAAMGEEVPERASDEFERHDGFEHHDGFEATGPGFALTTTEFENLVTVDETDDRALRYELTVRLPMLSSAVNDPVGPALEDGWFETLELRLEDALSATRYDVDLEEYALERVGGEALARYAFETGNADRAPRVVRSIVEYVEGTYLQGVVPGYDYRDPVAGMLAKARQSADEDDTGGPMPL